jgi:hypothetical protein
MNNNRLSHLVVFGLLFFLTACQAAEQPLSPSMIGRHDRGNETDHRRSGRASAGSILFQFTGGQRQLHPRLPPRHSLEHRIDKFTAGPSYIVVRGAERNG